MTALLLSGIWSIVMVMIGAATTALAEVAQRVQWIDRLPAAAKQVGVVTVAYLLTVGITAGLTALVPLIAPTATPIDLSVFNPVELNTALSAMLAFMFKASADAKLTKAVVVATAQATIATGDVPPTVVATVQAAVAQTEPPSTRRQDRPPEGT